MAKFTKSGGKGYVLTVEIWEKSYSISTNSSVISYKMWLTANDGSYFEEHEATVKLWIEGTYIINSTKYYSISPYGGTLLLASGSMTIKHLDNGAKNIDFQTHMDVAPAYYTPSAMDITGKLTLTNIPRKSGFSGISGRTIGSTTKITFTPAVSNYFYHKFCYRIIGDGNNGNTGWIYPAGETPKKVDSVSYTIPLDYCSKLTKSISGKMEVWVGTYLSSTGSMIGESYDWYTIYVPESQAPIIDKVDISEAVSKIKNSVDVYVQTQSKLKIITTHHGLRGATITDILTEVDGGKYKRSSVTTNQINSSGNVNVKVTITDSRGLKKSYTKSVYVYPYKKPNIQAVSSNFIDATTMRVNVKGDITSLDNKNGKSLLIKYKKITDTSWSTKNVPLNAYSFDINTDISGLDNTFTYQASVELIDSITKSIIEVGTGIPVLSCYAGGKGIAVGKEADKEGFDIAFKQMFLRNYEIANFIKKRYYKDGWYVLEYEWVKTVVCIGKFAKTVTPSMWTSWGGVYYVDIGKYQYPEKVQYARQIVSISDEGGGIYCGVKTDGTDTNTGNIYVYRPTKPDKNFKIIISILLFGELTHE